MPDPKLSEKPGPDPDQYLHILVEQDGQIAAGLEAQESGPRHRPRMPAQAAQQLPRAHIPHLRGGGIHQTQKTRDNLGFLSFKIRSLNQGRICFAVSFLNICNQGGGVAAFSDDPQTQRLVAYKELQFVAFTYI